MLDLLLNINLVLVWVVPGYICCAVFRFVALNTATSEWNEIVLKSVAISTIIDLPLKFVENDIVEAIIAVIIAILIGYFAGVIVKENKFEKLKEKLKMQRSGVDNVFAELTRGNVKWWKIKNKKEGIFFYGQIETIDVGNGVVLMKNYTKQSIDTNEIIFDSKKEHDDGRGVYKVFIRISDIDYIEIAEKEGEEEQIYECDD